MKWIKCSDRLPKEGQHILAKWKVDQKPVENKSYELADFEMAKLFGIEIKWWKPYVKRKKRK